jgi:hypothetical protein
VNALYELMRDELRRRIDTRPPPSG